MGGKEGRGADESEELGFIKRPVGGVMIQERAAKAKLLSSLHLTLILEPWYQLGDPWSLSLCKHYLQYNTRVYTQWLPADDSQFQRVESKKTIS